MLRWSVVSLTALLVFCFAIQNVYKYIYSVSQTVVLKNTKLSKCKCNVLQIKLGLVVDLTNTTRFYSQEELDKFDCKYVKLQCRG
jgi:hypothetical protein